MKNILEKHHNIFTSERPLLIPCETCIVFVMCKMKIIEMGNNRYTCDKASRSVLEENCEILDDFIKDSKFSLANIEVALYRLYGEVFKLSIASQQTVSKYTDYFRNIAIKSGW